MLIGCHVSTAGGLHEAVARGEDIGCDAIQIFNQSPRMWKPTAYGEEDFARFRDAMAASRIQEVVIHAVYLINCATDDPALREKSLTSLVQALTIGAGIGAAGVVLHPGSAKTGDVGEAIARCGDTLREALARTAGCDLLLEDTAGTGGTLGRSFGELSALLEAAGGDERLGLCLDSCHLLASGYDVRTAEALTAVLDDCDEQVGLDRLRCLHVNDSQTGLGSNRDRHAPLGEGEIGREGCVAFFSEPRFEGLPMIFEGPGVEGKGVVARDLEIAREMRTEGLATRAS
ncbi:deoxyribonuclease IV [Paraconexibacter sp.]|uniref:deoxyribonuclease IV n=1 Tax=Paraconexibacter sp. TaxID=2949640 RepID=UPI003567465F